MVESDRPVRKGDEVAYLVDNKWFWGSVIDVFPLAKAEREHPENEGVKNFKIEIDPYEQSARLVRYEKLPPSKIFRLLFLDANGIVYVLKDNGVIEILT